MQFTFTHNNVKQVTKKCLNQPTREGFKLSVYLGGDHSVQLPFLAGSETTGENECLKLLRENVLNRWIQRRQVKVGILTNRKVQVLLDNSREHLKKEFRLSLSRTSPLLYATTHSNSQATWKLSCCTSRFTQGQGLKVGMIECF